MIKRLLIAAAIALGLSGAASAQSTVKLCYLVQSGTTWNCTDVSTTNGLPVSVVSGGGTGGTSSSFGATFPATGTAIGLNDGFNMQPWPGDGTNGGYVQAKIGALVDGSVATLGAQADSVCGTSTGTCTMQALIKYANSQLASLVSSTPALGQAAMAGSVPVVIANNQTAVSVTAGSAKRAVPTWTVQNAAYSSGNSLGGLITATITSSNGQTGFLTNVRITDIHADTSPTLTIFLFDTDPTGTGSFACTDKAAYVNDPGAVPFMIAQPQVVTLAVPTGATYSYAAVDFTPPRPFAAGGSVKTIFACVIVNGSLTPNATTDFKIAFGAALN